MKRIKWTFVSYDNGENDRLIIPKDFAYSDEMLAAAKEEARGGRYEIYDDGKPDPASIPSQLDIIEAQVTYTALMTDTLLEEEI